MAETVNNQYSGSKRVITILGGVPSFYQNLFRYQVSRLLVLMVGTCKSSSNLYTDNKN